jgi:hypothetical protein
MVRRSLNVVSASPFGRPETLGSRPIRTPAQSRAITRSSRPVANFRMSSFMWWGEVSFTCDRP